MIEIDGKIYRNLEEQVRKNKEDIELLQNQQTGDDTDIQLLEQRINNTETILTEITPEVARALKTPISAPTSTELVAVDTSNGQAMLTIGDGLVVENDTLKSTGGVQIVDNLTSTSTTSALSANQGRVLNTSILTKANQSDLDNLETTVSTKANQSDLDNLETTVSTKANQSDLDSTNANVTSNSNQIGTLATEVANKANQSSLNTTNSQVSTNTGNISNLTNNKADKDLSNVTYPQVIANGVAQTGAGDRIVERWVSSDGNTWYEKYESGWKKCGGKVYTSQDEEIRTITFPLQFIAIPSVYTNFIYRADYQANYKFLCARSITTTNFKITLTSDNSDGTTWYALGY